MRTSSALESHIVKIFTICLKDWYSNCKKGSKINHKQQNVIAFYSLSFPPEIQLIN